MSAAQRQRVMLSLCFPQRCRYLFLLSRHYFRLFLSFRRCMPLALPLRHYAAAACCQRCCRHALMLMLTRLPLPPHYTSLPPPVAYFRHADAADFH
jgi:hypothetical protein